MVPKNSPSLCTSSAYICIAYVNGNAWKKRASHFAITSCNRTMNLAFVEFCNDAVYGENVDLQVSAHAR